MTRYSNPLPHNQVPNSQGRPAGSGQPAPASPYGQPIWPAPANQPRTAARPAAPGYGDAGGYGADPQAGGQPPGAQHDPYAALRPDGYGYSQPPQPADPYGLAGYTAPQPQQGYGTRGQPQMPAGDPYGASSGYPPQGQPAPSPYSAPQTHSGYGALGHGFGGQSPAAPVSPYGADYGAAPAAGSHSDPQWGGQSLALDARDYGHGYAGHGAPGQWGGDHYGDPQLEPGLGPVGGYPNAPPQQHASFDQSYAEDEAQYEDEPRRGGWKKVVGLVACTILVGGGLVIGYTSIMGGGSGKDAPLVKGASGPSKVKPSDPGGKQFAHADSKIMGRLGDGGREESADPAGVRKVPVVTVGRDGSIQPPSSVESEDTRAVVSVPGLTVIDGLGGGPSPTRAAGPQQGSPPVQMVASSEPSGPVVVAPPKKTVTASEPKAAQTKPPAAPKADPPPKKVAAAAPADVGPKPTGAGYVAVLASVPASDSSRIDALKQFADMQQKYGMILQNKTPDVQEANLGEKGTYHRLLVGPPGSRDSASSVCTQLKAQGYSGCWVTAY
ncbi:SPOR domain-containing protein [Hyphomicrobium sp.]|uniref:SPOR domain-containing protein n=1 Tax=Hyphomicrobium sp. TaxID=82 RepID=UPI0025BA08C9|nr:SPOR domain-containing protein [Hyphomicrobium sp.]MCC7251558.1 SPOR domain-containing protein [Hyphomicrobium sp.]